MAIGFRAGQKATTAGATTLTCNKPTGVVSGDVLYAIFASFTGSEGTITQPSGWTQVSTRQATSGAGHIMGVTFWRKVAGASEPASYTWTWTIGEPVNITIVAYSGVDNTTPEDVMSAYTSGSTSVSSVTLNSITPTVAGAWVGLCANVNGPYNAAPAGFVDDYDDGGNSNGYLRNTTATTAGVATGTAAWGIGAGNAGVALSLNLKAAGSGSSFNQSVSDQMSGTDVATENPTKVATDATSGADTQSKAATKPAADAQSGVDVALKAPQKAVSEAQSGFDSLSKATTAVFSDSQSALDALSHLWSAHLALSEAISSLDAAQKVVLAPILDRFSQTDSLTKSNQVLSGQNWRQTLTESLSETDLLASWTLLKLLGDAYAATDAHFNQVGRPLYDVSSGHDSLTKTVLALLSDAGVLTDVAVKQLQTVLLDVASAVDKVTAGKVLLLTLLDHASLLDSPMETYTKAQWGLLGLITSLVASSLGMTITFTNSTALAASTTLLAGALAMVFSIPF